jgi:O-antigen/teichoic acid export membrane protein
MSLTEKTVNGLIWSFVDRFTSHAITFVIGIILARLLTPREYGLIGMMTIFIAISSSFINSGFSQALIRKPNCTPEDYSTVFYFNFIVGLLTYLILFFSAPFISIFFKEPQLTRLSRVLGFVLIIDSFSIIQRTTLTKKINFKLQTRISIISSLSSGLVGISMAYAGYGVWSLVFKTISMQSINCSLLWLWNKWRPIKYFSMQSFRELFSFGSKLLASGLFDTAYHNIYYLVIGKYFSTAELGYYTRADMFKNLPSQNINGIISRVSYPILATLQDNDAQLKAGYKRIITCTMLITFVLMIGLAAVSESMVITLIGDQWRPSIIYLQLLCFVGMLYPLHSLNLNMLNVKGRSDLFLRLEIIKKILAIPIIIIGVLYGIKMMITGMIFISLISYYLNSYWSGKIVGYPMREQVLDIMPSFGIGLSNGIFVFISGYLMPDIYLLKLILQISIGAGITVLICELFRPNEYLFIKDMIIDKFGMRKDCSLCIKTK